MKKFFTSFALLVALMFGANVATAEAAPKSVIHVVTVSWKPDATEAQIQAALDGVHALTESFPGITRVWTRCIKAQGDRQSAFVMEFKDEQALKDYAGSEAQKAWYTAYYVARGGSTTFDITN
jgi:antibiotic biosynthesis monooxygenase (ABM) superfamily enzyme